MTTNFLINELDARVLQLLHAARDTFHFKANVMDFCPRLLQLTRQTSQVIQGLNQLDKGIAHRQECNFYTLLGHKSPFFQFQSQRILPEFQRDIHVSDQNGQMMNLHEYLSTQAHLMLTVGGSLIII